MDVPIKVPLPEHLEKLLAEPICVKLPPPAKLELNLPTGGKIQALVDATNAVPNDCSLSFSLALQLGPILANLDCFLKLLKVIEPLITVVTALPNMLKVAEAMPKLVEAVGPLLECIAKVLGLGLPLFLRDVLILIIKILSCVVGNLKSILAVMGGLALQIQSAQSAGNTELLAALQCAQDNANASAQHMMSAIEPVTVLLSLAEPMLAMAGVDPIKTPTIGSAEDIEGLTKVVTTLEDLVKVLQLVVDTPPLKQ
jgi:hypothetical protein